MPNATRSKVLTIVYAIHDFQAENPDELSFSAGEAIEVTEKDDLYCDGWWQGRNTKGQFGLFPQAYTMALAPTSPDQSSSPPNQSSSKSTPQPTMTETLSEVQHAIDQLHHPSSSTISLPPSANSTHPIDVNTVPTTPHKPDHSDEGDDTDDRDPTFHLHNHPAKARALLAQKAQADSNNNHSTVMERLKSASNQLHSNHRASVASLISVPGIGDIELSEESGGDDDQDYNSSYQSNHRKHPTSTAPAKHQRPPEKTTNRPPTPTGSSSPKLLPQRSSDSSRQAPFKAGPFSAAAMALGLTRSPMDSNTPKPPAPSFEKSHKAHLPSSSSILSDFGLDLREHFNAASAPVASTLRMSRQSSQFANYSPAPNLQRAHSNSVLPSNEDQPISPQEFLSEAAAATGPSARSQENLSANPTSHHRRASNCSTGSGVFSSQQLTHPPNPPQPITQDTKTSVSTADSSSVKGSRSRSSSRVEQFVSVEDQASPATSTFPSSAGARQGGGSLSSSHSKSHRPVGFGSLSYASSDEWSVSEVIEWAKAKGFDEFTISKFTEHEITGDVLMELDVNALKEIDLTAFGRRVRVMKAIDELKRHRNIHKQPQAGLISPPSDVITSIDSTLQETNLSNPRKEFASNHVSRPSFHSKQDYSNFSYRQTYQPSAELSDREEEVVHHSVRNSSSKFSSIQSHSKRPSDASALSFHRFGQNDNRLSSREELQARSSDPTAAFDRPSSTVGRPRLATFSNHDRAQHNHPQDRAKSPNGNTGRSRCSSWTPPTECQEIQPADMTQSANELDDPITLQASPMDPNEKPKKVKKKKMSTPKPPSTAHSTKNKKASFDSPDHHATSPVSPQKSQESTNAKSRTSFLGNLRGVRKPPPKLGSHTPVESGPSTNHTDCSDLRPGSSPGLPSSLNGRPSTTGRHGRSLFNFGHEKVQGQAQHQIQHLKPLSDSKNLISSPVLIEENESKNLEMKPDGETRTALERIGTPDHVGWMRKKGEKYPTWKLRYFVLKGSNLYYLKSQNEIRIKGLIKLSGFKVVVDADVHPGRYGFRIIHDNGSSHLFSADDSKLLRDWMKAMMKATIDRDWIAPVISSCNIRTISIREAQKMFPPPRPPSPQSRSRLQKARLVANADVLTEKDAAVLRGMQNLQGSPGHLHSTHPSVSSSFPDSPENKIRPRRSTHRPSGDKATGGEYSRSEEAFEFTANDQVVLDWINDQIANNCSMEAKDYSNSIRNGMILVRLIESLTKNSSGLSDEHFLQVDHVRESEPHTSIIQKDEDFDVYFTIFDYFNNQKIPLEGYSLNDLISGDPFKTRDFVMRVYNKFKT